MVLSWGLIVAARGFGMRTVLVGSIHKALGDFTIQKPAGSHSGGAEGTTSVHALVHFGLYGGVGRSLTLIWHATKHDCARETDRSPPSNKIGIGARARAAWNRKLNVQSEVGEVPSRR